MSIKEISKTVASDIKSGRITFLEGIETFLKTTGLGIKEIAAINEKHYNTEIDRRKTAPN